MAFFYEGLRLWWVYILTCVRGRGGGSELGSYEFKSRGTI